jgi:adenylylsulfate kinase-like enzyme
MGRIVPTSAGSSLRIARVLVVVIGGPIASGKSALSRAVAAQLEEAEEVATAVIDLDLVYELLDPRRRTKDDADLWAEARRVAGRLTTALLAESRCVVAEGEFASDQALREFVSELPGTADLRLVLLDVDLETALRRASADASRGLSKDATFLSRHYREFRPEWVGHDVLRLDTTESTLGEAARAVVDWLTPVA